jgi:sugar lactone lactonase YvrE
MKPAFLRISRHFRWILLIGAAAALAGCILPLFTTRLLVSLDADFGDKSLTPGISLDVTQYDIHGSGAGTFSATGVQGTRFVRDGLVPGAWTFYAVGKNAAGDAIVRSPDTAVTLEIGETTAVSLTCLPETGNGTLSISLSWPAGSIITPAIEATFDLMDASVPATLPFTITGDTATLASAVSTPKGYYELVVKLIDRGMNDHVMWSKVEAVYILKNRETAADWDLVAADLDQPIRPGIALTLASDSKKPLNITLSGRLQYLAMGQTMTVIAVGSFVPSSWQWYLDGNRIAGATTESVTIGANLASRSRHTLTVLARSGDKAGSADHRFEMVSNVSTYAGSGAYASADGTGTAASFKQPHGLVLNGSGTIFVSDSYGHRIRRIASGAVVDTFAGSGTEGSADGQGIAAEFNRPVGIAIAPDGTLYIADWMNNKIRKITAAGLVSTVAGSDYGYADGTGSAAMFRNPNDIAIDSSGNLFVTDFQSNLIRKITPAGVVSTFAGTLMVNGTTDGTGTAASFHAPWGICIDGADNLYVTDTLGQKIRKITPAGVVTTIAGTGTQGFADGPATSAMFWQPSGIEVDEAGNLYVCDAGNCRIRKINPLGVVTTIAGTGTFSSLDGPGTSATFNNPRDVCIDASGNLYIAGGNDNKIRKIVQ